MKKLRKERPDVTYKTIQYQDDVRLDNHVVGMVLNNVKLVCVDVQDMYVFLNDKLEEVIAYETSNDLLDNMHDDATLYVFETRKEASAWLFEDITFI